MFIRDNDTKTIKITKNTKTILEMKFISDEFVCIISTDDKIVITEDIDKSFYDSLSSFMENRYVFNNTISKKTPDKLIWLSDQHGDISNAKAAIDVSTKCFVGVVLMAALLLKLGQKASISSMIKSSFAISKYESNVLESIVLLFRALTSSRILW